jgi:ubiquinone/menaquinone biosynthesis C-methylase UbiE
MIMKKRWEIAQNSEKEYWNQFNKNNVLREANQFKDKADNLLISWKKYIKIDNNTKFLQVGGAVFDVINQIKIGKRYAIDPLADFYKEKFNLDYGEVNFKKGVGEKIPYPDKFFDVVILANVIDHVSSPEKVLSECRRVLKEDGLFYLDVYIATEGFIRISKIWAFIQKVFMNKIFNIHHPFMFSIKDVKKLLKKGEFKIIEDNVGKDYFQGTNNFKEVKTAKKHSPKRRIRLLANLGMYGDVIYNTLSKKRH